jgi:hypothetical protein
MSRCPCHGCTERYPACHDHCHDKYIPWKEQNEAKRESSEEAKRKEYNQYTLDVIAKNERFKQKHPGI